MKPQNLKFSIAWNRRQIAIQDRVLFVPYHCDKENGFQFPDWSHPEIFGRNRPICIEYCSGNGAWITAKAQSHPEYNWVAVEKKFDQVRKIWSKLKNYAISNLFTIYGEGYNLTKQYLSSSSVHAVYINFPDPWPKKRHAKHRLIQEPFIEEIYRILQPGGVLTMVTDDYSYSQVMINLLLQNKGFHSLFPEPYYTNEYPSYGTSFFEELWRQKGKLIRYHSFKKVNDASMI